jgi:hypothetical protein
MNEEQDLEQSDTEALAPVPTESDEPDTYSDDPVFASLIKRYGFTPQQAREVMLYL